MTRTLAVAFLLIFACSREKPKVVPVDRFAQSLINIDRVAMLTRLTQDDRCVYPTFSPGDTIIFFKKLLITDPADTFAYRKDEFWRSYGIHVATSELYMISSNYGYRGPQKMDLSFVPERYSEEVVWGLTSPDSGTFAFETVTKGVNDVHRIYFSRGDSIIQLSYGDTSCFLDRFSNTGRYITALYGTGPTWVLVLDLKAGAVYRITRMGDYIDYMTNFSSDDKMVVFVRSDRRYMAGTDYLGDIWLVRLDKAGK